MLALLLHASASGRTRTTPRRARGWAVIFDELDLDVETRSGPRVPDRPAPRDVAGHLPARQLRCPRHPRVRRPGGYGTRLQMLCLLAGRHRRSGPGHATPWKEASCGRSSSARKTSSRTATRQHGRRRGSGAGRPGEPTAKAIRRRPRRLSLTYKKTAAAAALAGVDPTPRSTATSASPTMYRRRRGPSRCLITAATSRSWR